MNSLRVRWLVGMMFASCLLTIGAYHLRLGGERQDKQRLETELVRIREQLQQVQAKLSEPPVCPKAECPAAATPIEAIYNPESSEPGAQSALDALKKRFESILVTYFFLKKCGYVATADYYVITAALAQEVASLNAPGRLHYDIISAARGSYEEIYAKSDCTSGAAKTTHTQFTDYLRALERHAAPQEPQVSLP